MTLDQRSEQRGRAAARARRVRRIVFSVSLALVLVFVAATVSYGVPFGITGTGPQRSWGVGFARGDLLYLRSDSGGALPQGVRWRADRTWYRTAGMNSTQVSLSYGVISALFGLAVSGLVYQGSLAERRAKRGLCRVCEYDLRGLDVVEGHKTCPECGTRKRAVVRAV